MAGYGEICRDMAIYDCTGRRTVCICRDMAWIWQGMSRYGETCPHVPGYGKTWLDMHMHMLSRCVVILQDTSRYGGRCRDMARHGELWRYTARYEGILRDMTPSVSTAPSGVPLRGIRISAANTNASTRNGADTLGAVSYTHLRAHET